jgi:Ca2+-binding EF-hand superfamily protein
MGMMPNMYGTQRPDPEKAAQQLFASLDTENQGYIEKADLQSALQEASSASGASDLTIDESDLDELVSALDSDGDGKITEEEFTDSLAQLDEEVSNLFSQMRMNDAQNGMMPPPPPPPPRESDSAQLEEIGDSDSERSTLIQSIIDNFDEADSDGDGRVNLEEAMAFDQASGVATSESDETAQIGTKEKLEMQIMRLIQAYNLVDDTDSGDSPTLSVTT